MNDVLKIYRILNNIFQEKSVCPYICLFVCLSVPSVPSRPVPEKKSLKQKILLNKVVRYTSRVTKILSHPAVLGEAKPSYVYLILKPQFRVSLPPQSQSQVVVCVSTPRMYLQSGYFLVLHISFAILG